MEQHEEENDKLFVEIESPAFQYTHVRHARGKWGIGSDINADISSSTGFELLSNHSSSQESQSILTTHKHTTWILKMNVLSNVNVERECHDPVQL